MSIRRANTRHKASGPIVTAVPLDMRYVEAAKYRAEAARLREELAQLENQPQPTASVPTP